MNLCRQITWRWRALFQKEELDGDMEAELRAHLEMATQENIAAGMTPEEARYAAVREFGSPERVKESCRDERGFRWLEDLAQDLRFGTRVLWKNRGFGLVATLTLALGIGLNTAVFSVVYAVLFRPLPWHRPDRVTILWASNPTMGFPNAPATAGDFRFWRSQATSFQEVAAATAEMVRLTGGDRPRRVLCAAISPNLLALFAVRPVLGQAFSPQSGNFDGVFISERLWRRDFGASPRVVGSSIRINDRQWTVAGVLPSAFEVPVPNVDVWWTRDFSKWGENDFGNYNWIVFGRLKDGVAQQTAQSEMDVLAQRIAQDHPTKAKWGARVERIDQFIYGFAGRPLLFIEAGAAVVLLICCVNVANLLLARAAARQREMALRGALGAGRSRLMRQLLVESVLLAGVGGAAGLMLGQGLMAGLRQFFTGGGFAFPVDGGNLGGLPQMWSFRLDPQVLGFTVLATLATAILFGLVPAWRASRLDFSGALKSGESDGTVGRRGMLSGNLLVVAEVALCCILLVAAGLTWRSFSHLRHSDPGFDPAGLLTMDTVLSGPKYASAEQRIQFTERLLEAVTKIPGVQSAGVAEALPLGGDLSRLETLVEGRPAPDPGEDMSPSYRPVSPGYFQTLGVRVLDGRVFTLQDNRSAAPVVVINRAMARHYFPHEKAIGQRVSIGDGGPNPAEIIGVVENEDRSRIGGKEEMGVYRCLSQYNLVPMLSLAVRGAGRPEALARAVREKIASLDPDLPFEGLPTMEQRVAASLALPRIGTQLLGVFATGALVLAALGIYGVLAYTVSRRTHEIGIRMALGARQREVLGMVIWQGLKPILAGLLIGLFGAVLLTRGFQSLLYGVAALDPVTYAGVAALLLAVSLLACWLPARRAVKVDPMIALRYE